MTAKKKKAKRPAAGRPSTFSEERFVGVLVGIIEGKKLPQACRPRNLPSKATFLRWISKDVKLASRYVEATQGRALGRADECVPIADDCRVDSESIQKARLRIQTRQWEIQRLANKVYGRDGVVEETSGDDSKAARLQRAIDRKNKTERSA